MKHKSAIFICACITLCVMTFCIQTHAQKTVIKAGHMFDAATGTMVSGQVIIISNGIIEQVGPNLKYGATDTVIDLSNAWVLPGLMDCHVHLTANFNYRNPSIPDLYTTESNAYRALRGAYVARQYLENGFTTIKEIGNDANYATADIIKAIRQGWTQGPTIFYAGKIIAPYGGQTSGINIEHEHLWDIEFIDADSPDEIKKAVRKNIYYGANSIKLVADQQGYYYDSADIKAAVDEAGKAGLKVTAHVMGGQAARNVIMGGAAAIEHGFELDEALLRLMKEKGTFLVGTDLSADNFYAYGMDSLAAKSMESTVVDRLKKAYAIGTKMAFGTDVVIDIPGLNRIQTNLKVLQTWKAANIPPAYVLQTMTIYAAELLGIGKSRGTIAPLYRADIIALSSNPLDNIEAISTVQFVMKDGTIIKRR